MFKSFLYNFRTDFSNWKDEDDILQEEEEEEKDEEQVEQ